LRRTFTRLLGWIVVIPVAILVIAFAVANRHGVTVSLDPLPVELVGLPLFSVIFAGIVLGVLLGGFAAWLRARRWRREAQRQRREAERLARELEKAQARQAQDRPSLPHVA
jgi:uncharacterized integral membrane protein